MRGDGFVQHALLSSLQLWRDVIDGLVGHSLWLRALLGLPEKETIYLDLPEEQGQTAAMPLPTPPPPGSGPPAICTLLVETPSGGSAGWAPLPFYLLPGLGTQKRPECPPSLSPLV